MLGGLRPGTRPSRVKRAGQNSAMAMGVCGALFVGAASTSTTKARVAPTSRMRKNKLAKEKEGLSKLPSLKDAGVVQNSSLKRLSLVTRRRVWTT